jgi:hypothetical protein
MSEVHVLSDSRPHIVVDVLYYGFQQLLMGQINNIWLSKGSQVTNTTLLKFTTYGRSLVSGAKKWKGWVYK